LDFNAYAVNGPFENKCMKMEVIEKNYPDIEDFSLARSGRLHSVLRWLGFVDPSIRGYAKRSLALIAVTWLPLLLLSAFQGLAWGHRADMNFLEDFAMHLRFLVVMPMLIFAEYTVDYRLKELTAQFFKSGILGEKDFPAYEELQKKIKKLSDWVMADWLILAIVITNIVIRWIKNTQGISHWLINPDEQGDHISWAGFWFVSFCFPVIQYILLRWVWRWIIWVKYFIKISRMSLQLSSAHPDKAGGIGFLGVPPTPFLLVTLAMAILFSSVIAEKIFWFHERLPNYYSALVSFIVLSVVINVLPLIVFILPLARQRRRGIFKYSTLIKQHHSLFDEKWLDKKNVEMLLGSQDASSTTDLNSTFDTVMSMRVFPFNLKTMVSTIVIAMLPMVPLLALEFDFVELLKKVMSMLI